MAAADLLPECDERISAAGRLDWLMKEALDDLDAGRCTDR
jgi:hypothetical protein